eukprot:552043_1
MIWWKVHAYSAGLAVALGAFGAHGLKAKIQDTKLLDTWTTACHYQFMHSICGLIACFKREYDIKNNDPNLYNQKNWANLLAFIGNVLFSGSLYALVLTRIKKLGAITPIGGMCYIFAWICLANGW